MAEEDPKSNAGRPPKHTFDRERNAALEWRIAEGAEFRNKFERDQFQTRMDRESKHSAMRGRPTTWLREQQDNKMVTASAVNQSASHRFSSLPEVSVSAEDGSPPPPIPPPPDPRPQGVISGNFALSVVFPFSLLPVGSGSEAGIRIVASTLAGGTSTDIKSGPSGSTIFSPADTPPYVVSPSHTSGVIQGGIEVTESGEVTSRWIEAVPGLSSPSTIGTSKRHYVEIGTFIKESDPLRYTVSNSRYGPIEAGICRDWFSNPPTYGVSFESPTGYFV